MPGPESTNMDHFQRIYNTQATHYDRLVGREDQRGNLFAAIMELHPLSGAVVAEWGAGTGRVTRLLATLAQHVYAFDLHRPMLRVAAEQLEQTGMVNWSLATADHAAIPMPSNSADLCIQGWSFGHTMTWHADHWQARLDAILTEMRRVVKPGGTLILIETLGTGERKPAPPTPELARLYAYWQNEQGFAQRWIRTDYQFASAEETHELLGFFFGAALAERFAGQTLVPECTGIWWQQV